MKRCIHCQAPFGLVRYYRSRKQFCSRACRREHPDAVSKSIEKMRHALMQVSRAVKYG
jgi:recombinational DNA repair protein (RecF pathway)